MTYAWPGPHQNVDGNRGAIITVPQANAGAVPTDRALSVCRQSSVDEN